MSETFITRPLDENGRIVIPMEFRRAMKIQPNDLLEISAKNGVIMLSKHVPGCLFCGDTNNTIYFHGKTLCRNCVNSIKDAF